MKLYLVPNPNDQWLITEKCQYITPIYIGNEHRTVENLLAL